MLRGDQGARKYLGYILNVIRLYRRLVTSIVICAPALSTSRQARQVRCDYVSASQWGTNLETNRERRVAGENVHAREDLWRFLPGVLNLSGRNRQIGGGKLSDMKGWEIGNKW